MSYTDKELALKEYEVLDIEKPVEATRLNCYYRDYGVYVEWLENKSFSGEETIDRTVRLFKGGIIYEMNPKSRKMSKQIGTYKENQ